MTDSNLLQDQNADDFHSYPNKEKLRLTKNFEDYLSRLNLNSDKIVPKEKPPKRFMLLRKIAYYFVLALGLIRDAVGMFLFGHNLISLIPLLPTPFILVLSVAFSLLHGILFYAFEGAILRRTLGIKDKTENINEVIEAQLQQIHSVKKINAMIFDLKVMDISPSDYEEYKRIALILNEDIEKQKANIANYESTPGLQAFRWFVTGFGALTTLASSYFLATTFLAIFSVSLAATPLAWIFVATVIIASLSFYGVMHAKGMATLVNSEQKHFKELRKELESFEVKKEENFTIVTTMYSRLGVSSVSEINGFSSSYPEFFGDILRKSERNVVSTNPFDEYAAPQVEYN